MSFDLHVHSVWSDGIHTVHELAEKAKNSGLSGFALTDHDTIEGWREIAATEARYGVTIIPGVELSTNFDGYSVHILGYLMKDIPGFQEDLRFLSDARTRRVEKMVALLRELDYEITFADVRKEAGVGTVGRPHIAAVMVAKGYFKDRQKVFDRLLNKGKPAYVPREHITPVEGIEMIHRRGGIAVLAHPGLDQVFELIPMLTEKGIDGIEAYHSTHTPKTAAKFAAMAAEAGLFVTAGSDHHGFGEDHGVIGSVSLEDHRLPGFLQAHLKEHEQYVERI